MTVEQVHGPTLLAPGTKSFFILPFLSPLDETEGNNWDGATGVIEVSALAEKGWCVYNHGRKTPRLTVATFQAISRNIATKLLWDGKIFRMCTCCKLQSALSQTAAATSAALKAGWWRDNCHPHSSSQSVHLCLHQILRYLNGTDSYVMPVWWYHRHKNTLVF